MPIHRHLLAYATIAIVGILPACASDKIASVVPPDIDTLVWSFQSDIKATTIAVGEHQQIVATPRLVSGAPATGLAAPTYRSADPAKVTVDATGMLTAVSETGGVYVIASLKVQGLTYVDTTLVAVTSQRTEIASLTIVSQEGDRISLNNGTGITCEARNSHGDVIDGLAIAISTLDPKRVTVYSDGGPSAYVQASAIGTARVVATTTSYGVAKVDTMDFLVQYPTSNSMFVQLDFNTKKLQFSDIVIGAGGTVTWNNFTPASISIIFDDGAVVPGGSIASIEPTHNDSRTFPAVGTYGYTDTATGATGRVFVRKQPVP